MLTDVTSEGVAHGVPSVAPPACSIVVSTRDRPERLASCLRSVREQGHASLEIIVVDSAPRSADAGAIAREFRARYVYEHRPGLSRARNRGARVADGEVVVFLDDDLTLQAGCIAALVEEFADPGTVAVGGRIALADGDDAARRAFEAFGGFDPGPDRRAVDRETPGWFELVNFGGLGSGAMLALRRSLFDSWPGFDERLGRGAPLDGGEELLAYFSLVERGYRVVYTPRAVARHPAPASLGELRRRVLAGAATGTAYLCLLIAEHPRHRREALRYAAEALRGKRRDWRSRPVAARHEVVSRARMWLAWALGPLIYARMRVAVLAGGRSGAGPDRPVATRSER